jgi:predicted lipid-binding transport protein (Tim44 family)
MMLHIRLAALGLVTTALVAAGCGSSSKTSSTQKSAANSAVSTPAVSTPASPPTTKAKLATGKALTKAQLIAKADAICARSNAKTSAIPARSVQDLPRVLPQVAIYNRAEAAELAKLVPPSSLTHDWSQMINDLELHSHYSEEVVQLMKSSKPEAAGQPFHQSTVVLEDLLTRARHDGFKRCSRVL